MSNEFSDDLVLIDAPQWFLEKWAGVSKIYIPYTLVKRRSNNEMLHKFESGADRRQLQREYNISEWAFIRR